MGSRGALTLGLIAATGLLCVFHLATWSIDRSWKRQVEQQTGQIQALEMQYRTLVVDLRRAEDLLADAEQVCSKAQEYAAVAEVHWNAMKLVQGEQP